MQSEKIAFQERSESEVAPLPKWTFLTNHFHVLIQLHSNPSLVLREVARQIGITERAVQRIISDLEDGNIIKRQRVGRKNRYRINLDEPLRHPLEANHTIGELLDLIVSDSSGNGKFKNQG